MFSNFFNRALSFRVKQERNVRNPRCSETTTLAVEIPDDIVEEILPRLSVKSMVRLKSVSKEWRSQIRKNKYPPASSSQLQSSLALPLRVTNKLTKMKKKKLVYTCLASKQP